MDLFGDNLYNLYGSTEVAWATIATPEDLRAAPGTAGRPPRGTVVRLYDEEGNEVAQGETGRIFVGNEMLFEGYTGGGGKDVIDGLMSTGDVGHFDEAGRLFVDGRDDDMIVSGGENVFPGEVEDLLADHDGDRRGAVIGVDDEEFGQRLKAFVVVREGRDADEDEVKKHVKANLAGYKVPRDVEFLDELPRNATGKVLKRELARTTATTSVATVEGMPQRTDSFDLGRWAALRRGPPPRAARRVDAFDSAASLRGRAGAGPVRLDVSRMTDNGYALRLRFAATLEGPVHALPGAGRARRSRSTRARSTSPAAARSSLALRRRGRGARPGGLGARRARARAARRRSSAATDCAGLCPKCGENLNDGPEHDHEAAPDPRWAKLCELKFD